MNISIKNYVPMFQEGGEMPTNQAAPMENPNAGAAPEAGGDPMTQILDAAAQAVQAQDCNLAMQILQALLQMAGGGASGAENPTEQPVYKMGGKLSRWIPKN